MRHHVSRPKAAFAALILFAASGAAGAVGCGPVDPTLAGRYVLDGEEIGSELLLRADGHFEYLLAYGASGTRANGCWRRQDGQVVLETARPPAPALRLLRRLSIDGRNSPESMQLVPPTDTDLGAAGDTVVVALNQALAGTPVWLEYADGHRAQQRADGNGRAHFARAGMPAVRRVGIGRPGDAAPSQWFDNEEADRRLFLVDSDGASARYAPPPAFRRMALEVMGPGSLSAHLGQGVTGRYERR